MPETTTDFVQADAKDRMCDILLPKEVQVYAKEEIHIMVRFTSGDNFDCYTLLGYGGENYERSIP